ncbi:MAG: PIN domain-containing protein [Leuconostoc suionicum]|uniref:PIN domain-containing protein n=1 Tax=Leuconostoc suionicum TaxID=1511761 RepID=UPI003F354A5A
MKPNIKNPTYELRSNSSIILDTNIWLQRVDLSYTSLDYEDPKNATLAIIEDTIIEILSKNITIYVLPTIISEIVNVTERHNFKMWCKENGTIPEETDYKRDYRNNIDSTFLEDNRYIWQSIGEEILNQDSVKFLDFTEQSYLNECIEFCNKHPTSDFNDVLIVKAAKKLGASVFSQDKDLRKLDIDITLYTVPD